MNGGEFKSTGEVVETENDRAAFFGCGKMLAESLSGGVKEFRMMRLVRAEFGKSRERRGLKVVGGDTSGRGIAGVDDLRWKVGG